MLSNFSARHNRDPTGLGFNKTQSKSIITPTIKSANQTNKEQCLVTTVSAYHHRAGLVGECPHNLFFNRPQYGRRAFDKRTRETCHFHSCRNKVQLNTPDLPSQQLRKLNFHACHALIFSFPSPSPALQLPRAFNISSEKKPLLSCKDGDGGWGGGED